MKKNLINIYKAKKLLETNQLLIESLEIDQILENIVRAASELIENSDVLSISLYDEQTNTLRCVAGVGIDGKHSKKISIAPGESVFGKVYMEKKPRLYGTEKEIEQAMEDMTKQNLKHFHRSVYGHKLKSIYVIPIISKGICYGVAGVGTITDDPVITEEDIQVFNVIINQSAIAIDHSTVYSNLKEKNQLLLQSISTNNQFYQLMIEEKGIQDVVSLLEKLISSQVSFAHEQDNDRKNNTFPIVRGQEVLGVLKLEKPFTDFSNMDKNAIRQASFTIALELIKYNAMFEKEIRFREELFNKLIAANSEKELDCVLRYVKWEKDWKIQCIILEGKENPLWKRDSLVDKERLVQSIDRMTNLIKFPGLVFTQGLKVIIVIPKHIGSNINDLIEQIKQYWQHTPIIFGIGRQTNIQDLELSYKEAVRSIGYARTHNLEKVEFSLLGFERILYEVDEDVLEMFMNDKLKNIETLDESAVNTLHSFIKQNKNHKQTAKSLHIHPNTLYYRLRKIEETLNINFNNEEDWIDVVIAFRLYAHQN